MGPRTPRKGSNVPSRATGKCEEGAETANVSATEAQTFKAATAACPTDDREPLLLGGTRGRNNPICTWAPGADGVLEGRVENREVCGRVQGPTPTQEHVVQAWKGWPSGGEFTTGRDGRWRDSARGPGGGHEPAPRPQEADGVLRSGADPPGRGPLGICSPAPKKCHSGTAHRERPPKRATGRETGTPATGERPPPGRCAAHM